MERLSYDYFNYGIYFLLRCIAYFILQPIFISKKFKIKPKTIIKLKSYLPILSETAVEASKLFRYFKVDCSKCDNNCCQGGFDRFTVFDYIINIVRGNKELWRFLKKANT